MPVSGLFYYGSEVAGSWKIMKDGGRQRFCGDTHASEWVAVRSRLHSSAEEAAIVERYQVSEDLMAGSALKFCLIAEGSAHLYYRHGPTMEWDTAAGQAIVEHSGGRLSTPSGDPFLYNKESLVNGSFLCCASDPELFLARKATSLGTQ